MRQLGASTRDNSRPARKSRETRENVTDTVMRIGSTLYNVIVYHTDDTEAWRAEAAVGGRVIEVVDAPAERVAQQGIQKRLAERENRRARR